MFVVSGVSFIPYKVQWNTYACNWNIYNWRNIKSPELNAFPKLELLKTLLSFSRPWALASISVKQQFASATPNKFIE